jgi:type I restriction enzyme S subunit
MRSSYKRIGSYVREVKVRNKDLAVSNLQGIRINKQFMPSVANVIGTDLSKYKIVQHEQFAFNPMHVGRDEVLPIGMLEAEDSIIVSPAYVVFEVVDKEELLPEYLMMWCRRSEFDRNAWFTTDSSVRGGFSWADFCDLELPVPDIGKQREIVKEYRTIVDRIALNEKLNQKLEETAQAIYKQWFVDFEFPISTEQAASLGNPELAGKPYKSSGGEMVWSDDLEQDIPAGWSDVRLDEFAQIKAGGDRPSLVSENQTDNCEVPIYGNSTVDEGLYGFTDKPKITKKCITVSARGAIIGYTVLRLMPFVPIVRLIVVIPKSEKQLGYLYECIKGFRFHDEASAQGQLTAPEISSFKILKPRSDLLEQYQQISTHIVQNVDAIKKEGQKLSELKMVLLSKMTKAGA